MKSCSSTIPSHISDENSIWFFKRIRSLEENPRQAEEFFAMDETIWAAFPEDLLIRVLSFLPISIILRTTLLCKTWRSIISSPFFLKLSSQIPPNSHHPWFLVFLKEPTHLCLAYDPYLNKWIHLSLAFIPSTVRPIAAGDGLLCLFEKTPSGFDLCILNPISKFHHRVPAPMSLFRYFFLVSGLICDRTTGSFRLVLVGSEPITDGQDQLVLAAQVYDFDSKIWVRIRSSPVSSPVSRWRTICRGVLYCVLGVSGHSPTSVIAFDVKNMAWFLVEAPFPNSLTVVRLMDHKNRLVLIGGVGLNGITEDIGIWQLGDSGREWVMIGWLDEGNCDMFLRSVTRQFGCTGHGDLIYFTSKKCPFVVMYDICKKCIKFLDPSPRLLDPHYHAANGFCFVPRL